MTTMKHLTRPTALLAALLCCAAAHSSDDLPDVRQAGIPAVKAWARQRLSEAERSFLSTGRERFSSPPSWEGVSAYQIQMDRFNNGNLSNDLLNVEQSQLEAMAVGDLSGLPGWRHGGDIQGVRDRLGYIADLGVQVLWLTPLQRHTGSYHGYCTTNPTEIDPGFGTPEELRSLVREAHELNIKVVLDIVINHLCDQGSNYSRSAGFDHIACTNSSAAQFWEGRSTPVVGQDAINFGSSFFAPFRSDAFFNRCGANSVEEMQGEGTPSVFGDFVEGMFDYNTTNKDFQELFTDLQKYWVAFADLDGLRLDAAKHVTQDFLAYFSTEVRTYARTLGKENFFLIGEVASNAGWQATSLGSMNFGKAGQVWGFHGEAVEVSEAKEQLAPVYEGLPEGQRYPGLPAVYNFEMSGTARDALQLRRNVSDMESFFSPGSLALRSLEGTGVPIQKLWIMLEIHDWPRFLTFIPERADLLLTAAAWLMTAPGSPVLYYGVEQGYSGRCPEAVDVGSEFNATLHVEHVCWCATHLKAEGCEYEDAPKRQDMFASGPWRLRSAVPEVDALAGVGNTTPEVSAPWQRDPMLPRDHAVYTAIRRLTRLRGSCSALRSGGIEWHDAAAVGSGLIVYSRWLEGDDGSDIFVIINPGGGGTVPVPRMATSRAATRNDLGLRYVNVFDASDVARADPSSDHLELLPESAEVAKGAVRIFVREDRLRDFDQDLGVALCAEDVVRAEPGASCGWLCHAELNGWSRTLVFQLAGVVLGSMLLACCLTSCRRRYRRRKQRGAHAVEGTATALEV